MSEWQPIASAPKDGTVIRVRSHKFECNAQWDAEHDLWYVFPRSWTLGPAKDIDDPTEWMPLKEWSAQSPAQTQRIGSAKLQTDNGENHDD